MASGKYWAGTLPANTFQDTGQVPTGKVRSVTINLVNNGQSAATCDIYVSTSATPSDGDLVEANVSIPAVNGLLNRTGEIISAGERVVIRANTNTVAARLSGFEENE